MRKITTPRAMKLLLPFLGCALLTASAFGQSDVLGALTSNINIEGLETSFDPNTGIASAIGDVHIIYEGVEIKSGRADYNANTGDIFAKENVTVLKEGQIFRGENITYNVKTQDLTANHIRSSLSPIFYDTDGFEANTEELAQIDGTQSFFTTHDSQNPMYRVKAKAITIYPGDRVVMRGVKVYAGKTPVFWFPYLVQPLDDELGYFFQPGYTSQWGAFLLNQYGVMHGDHTLAKYHLDLRSARGIGLGADYYSMKWKDNENIGHLKLYYAFDSDPASGSGSIDRSVENTPDEGRYRIGFQHRIFIPGPEESTWYLDFDLTKLSDEFVLEDYFLNDFRIDPQPDNHIKLVKHDDRFTATLLGRFQINDFYQTDTRLPELAFDFTRTPLWNTGVFYQGETSIGVLADALSSRASQSIEAKIKQQQTYLNSFGSDGKLVTKDSLGQPILDADGNPISTSTPALSGTTLVSNNAAMLRATPRLLLTRDEVEADLLALQAELSENKFIRAHTYNEFLYPMSFGSGNWVNFVPRIGLGATYYGDVEGGETDIGSDTRALFHIGFDFSAKFSKVWDDVNNRALGIDGIRHIVQPYINYSYLNADELAGLPTVDRLTPSTRPRPIDVPQFTAIDDLRTWNVARVGVRNILQTRRDDKTFNYAGLNSYVDIFLDDPEFDRDVSNFYNDFYWKPVPWLSFNVDSQLPIGSSDYNFTEVNTSISWMPTNYFSWTVGHQMLTDNPLFLDSSLITSRMYARLNDNWAFSMNHSYEMDDSTLEYQSYSIHRDLAAWTMAVGGLIRDNRGENEYGLVLSFTLKDFPNVSLPLDIDPNPTGTGGSGR
jgi:LPS-assembly protein